MTIIQFCKNVTYVTDEQVTSCICLYGCTGKCKLNYHPAFTSELYLLNICNLRLAMDIRIWQKSMKIFCDKQLVIGNL